MLKTVSSVSAHERDARFARLYLMVIDNTEALGETLRQSAGMIGIQQVRAFATPDAALASLVKERRPDIVFLNANGTAFDPIDVCRTIRSPREFPYPFVALVMVRSNVTRQDVLQARNAGVDEFLACPFSPKALEQRISSIVFDRRGFVDVPGFFGPDRRRGAMAEMLGAERRSGNDNLIDPETGKFYIG